MWTRAELKDRAKMCLSRYYWAAFLVSLIFAILSGFGGSNANTQRITSYLEQNESGNGSDTFSLCLLILPLSTYAVPPSVFIIKV